MTFAKKAHIFNRPFSKMTAENSNTFKLAKIKNVYLH